MKVIFEFRNPWDFGKWTSRYKEKTFKCETDLFKYIEKYNAAILPTQARIVDFTFA